MAGKNVYKIVKERIVAELEECIKTGTSPKWLKPWIGGSPMNYVTRKYYRGCNLLLLSKGGEYITWTQMQDLRKKNPEIKLKKGCKKEMIIFWKLLEKEEQTETGDVENKLLPLLRYYYVFHISDVEGIESKLESFEHEDQNEDFDNIINDYCQRTNLTFNEVKGSGKAFYSPNKHLVQVPCRTDFKNYEEFISTVAHELVHSTGHPNLLNRFQVDTGSGLFGSESYSKEELIAEMGANFLMGLLNIQSAGTQKNSVAYLTGWLSRIKDGDISFVLQASSLAQKACDLITNNMYKQQENEDENSQEVA